MLRQIDDNLWVAEQTQKFLGLEVGTRMTVIRRSDRSLILISPIAIDPETVQQLADLGSVTYLVAPNLFHYLYVARCQQMYPEAETIAPPGLSNKQPDLSIDKVFTQDSIELGSELEYTLLEGFQVFVPPKIAIANEIVFYHPESKTLIITDSAFNFDNSFPVVTQLAARALGSYKTLKPTWLEKIAVRDKPKLKQSIDRVLSWDFHRIIMAHGQIIDSDAKQQLTAGYQWLLR